MAYKKNDVPSLTDEGIESMLIASEQNVGMMLTGTVMFKTNGEQDHYRRDITAEKTTVWNYRQTIEVD